MALSDVQENLDKLAKAVGDNRAQANKDIKAIRDSKDLSPTGKASRIRDTYDKALKKHRELVDEFNQVRQDSRDELQREAFAPDISTLATPGEKTKIRDSYRQALSLADQAKDSADLKRLYQRAIRTADKHMELAVADVAFERGVREVTKEYFQRHPERQTAISEFNQFESTWGERRDKTRILQERAVLSPPNRPDEVSRGAHNAQLGGSGTGDVIVGYK